MVNNNLMRGALDAAQAALKLSSKDEAVRAEAAHGPASRSPTNRACRWSRRRCAAETNARIKAQLELVRAAIAC